MKFKKWLVGCLAVLLTFASFPMMGVTANASALEASDEEMAVLGTPGPENLSLSEYDIEGETINVPDLFREWLSISGQVEPTNVLAPNGGSDYAEKLTDASLVWNTDGDYPNKNKVTFSFWLKDGSLQVDVSPTGGIGESERFYAGNEWRHFEVSYQSDDFARGVTVRLHGYTYAWGPELVFE